MAREPLRKYQTELSRYGLGLGGIGSPSKARFDAPLKSGSIKRSLKSGIGSAGPLRTVFAEEGPASGGFSMERELYQDDPLAGLTREESVDLLKSMGIDMGNPTLAFQSIVERAKRRPESVLPDIPSDVGNISELAKAYAKVVETARPETSSTLPSVEDILSADPSVFNVEGPEMPKPKVIPKSPDDAVEQVRQQKKAQSAEDFRAEEAKIADMQGMRVESIDPKNMQKTLNETFVGAMDDFINSVRGSGPTKRERTLDEYKKEFSDATGVDISGKVDKSSTLMALGLALMQNRAGKGINVGNILSEVGRAGQAALPELEKAKEKAQSAAIAAGKYALQSRASDRAKDEAADLAGKKRGKYWVYKKGGKGTEFANFDEGEFVDLNPFELNKLIENKDFASQYEFIDASDRMSILEKRAEGVDLGDMWSGYERYSLIGGKADEVPPELQVLAAAADPNYAGVTPTRFKIAEDPKAVARRFAEYQKMINSGSAKFENLLQKLNQGVTIPEQFLSSANEILVGFGIGETSDITEAKRLLKNLAIDEATNILKESGKTLSDTDRQLVRERVGQISWGSADVEEIKRQLEDIYQLTVLKPQENLDRAMSWLEVNAGIQFGSAADDMPSQAELDAMNEVYGTNYTLDDYK